MNKANSINLSESWKQKIRDGAFRIEDVTDSDLWDKIQEYQTWWMLRHLIYLIAGNP